MRIRARTFCASPLLTPVVPSRKFQLTPSIHIDSYTYVCICFVLIYICETPRRASIQTGKLARLSASGLTIMETIQPKSGRPRKAAPT